MHQLRIVSIWSTVSFMFKFWMSALQSSQIPSNVHIHLRFSSGSLKSPPSYDQSVLNLSLCCFLLALVACLLCFCSHDDPLYRENCSTFPPYQGFTQLLHPVRCSQPMQEIVCFCSFYFQLHLRRRFKSSSGLRLRIPARHAETGFGSHPHNFSL